MINRVILNNTENILQKRFDKPDLSENKTYKTSCSNNDVLNHLHFTGATRFFKHHPFSDHDIIEKIMRLGFKDKSNGILGSLPPNLIKELQQVSKDKKEMTQKIKNIYEAFAQGLKKIKEAQNQLDKKNSSEEVINSALQKAGIKENLFEYIQQFQSGHFSNAYKFKLGDKEFVLKDFKSFQSDYLNKFQSGSHIELPKGLFANRTNLTTANNYLMQDKKTDSINYFKYVKVFWGDIKNGYLITKFHRNDNTKNELLYYPKNGILNLKPITELFSGHVCCDTQKFENLRSNTVIDVGNIFEHSPMNKAQKQEYKKLIESIFKKTTPDEFLANIIKNQDNFKSGFLEIKYVRLALTKAFDYSSKNAKKMFAQNINENFKVSMFDYAISNELLTKSFLTYITKNAPTKLLSIIEKNFYLIPEKLRFDAFKAFFPIKDPQTAESAAKIFDNVSADKLLKAYKMLAPHLTENIKIKLADTYYQFNRQDIPEFFYLLSKGASDELKEKIIAKAKTLNISKEFKTKTLEKLGYTEEKNSIVKKCTNLVNALFS